MIEISGYCVTLGETQVQTTKIEERGKKEKLHHLPRSYFLLCLELELAEVLTTNFKDCLKGMG